MILDFTQPIFGLAPMDGVTDGAFREIVAEVGKPDLIYTEFVHVMGICKGSDRLYKDFVFSSIQQPIVGQIFGIEPEYFYHAAKVVAELGFAGVDINMGCPAPTVASRGAGAGLIRQPELAKEIIRATQRGIKDWYETGELTGLESTQIEIIKSMPRVSPDQRKLIPVSVKTRIGYDEPITQTWIKILNECEPAWIALHGRTLKQLYRGEASWEEIAKAVEVSAAPILANGDINDYQDIKNVLKLTKAAGVLVGRATQGNPWFFTAAKELKSSLNTQTEIPEMYKPNKQALAAVIRKHAKLMVDIKGEKVFVQFRKHLASYIEDRQWKSQFVRLNNLAELETLVDKWLAD